MLEKVQPVSPVSQFTGSLTMLPGGSDCLQSAEEQRVTEQSGEATGGHDVTCGREASEQQQKVVLGTLEVNNRAQH